MARLQLRLPRAAELRQHDLAGIAVEFGAGEQASRLAGASSSPRASRPRRARRRPCRRLRSPRRRFAALALDDAASFLRRLDLEVDREDLGPRSEEHTSELQSLMRISYAV